MGKPAAGSRFRQPRRVRALAIILAALMPIALSVNSQAAAFAPVMLPLHTSGSQILDSSGRPFGIKAVNWFGMETTDCVPHGLWQINLDSGMAEIAAFGFNTIRLPFSNQCVEQTTPVTNVDFTQNPTLQQKTPLQIMDAVIASAKAHGLRIILDQHRPDSLAQSPLWYTPPYSEKTWIADWVMLANRYATEPAVIGADLHNEPSGTACWGCSNPALNWPAAATKAGDAVLAADPHMLIIVEGIAKLSTIPNTPTWWGEALDGVAKYPVTLDVPHQLVYSAHDYPNSVAPGQPWFSAKSYPANLPAIWDTDFGYLQKANTAPVFLGEFGTLLLTSSDKLWLATLVSYLKTNKMGFAYWSFNPDSGDTGGLVQGDWVTPEVAKLTALSPLGMTVPPPPPKPTPTPTPTTRTTAPTSARTTASTPVPPTTAPSTKASIPTSKLTVTTSTKLTVATSSKPAITTSSRATPTKGAAVARPTSTPTADLVVRLLGPVPGQVSP